jgi:hypothetical protein
MITILHCPLTYTETNVGLLIGATVYCFRLGNGKRRMDSSKWIGRHRDSAIIPFLLESFFSSFLESKSIGCHFCCTEAKTGRK